ncbi:Rrf2 family transcriptional regulator [Limosilactobacillus reuteri]|uniref:Rrf2 family transcriptional regulator n=1 Tax=Limosilactobacillus reuteri TaxID=1598 RepID=UPI001E5F3D93|nr:Rrf2 family transcriptional regulator [Limosilactobacillus reuteri]MCC4383000.1 Rrf2 family transcriptional regulator [Limosilactobacillus reuteri]MCC4399857.1 Rrf2 family transcriptional regulator [Limosilactobacillus reuteri]MCC4403096.1 Rrf2 family transcriptional regulator [Limosilactobacillus reuteri]MCC4419138.1 Rrf2 family transcriptional regulator [Limosilactobacillus reuteri]MCC4422237.1 Rrf2 family transcriptional regulator [Limosilactobacillus reuteri]
MRKSIRLSNAVHMMVLIALNPTADLSSKRLAESINTNPSFIRQIMSQLRKAGLLSSVTGHAEPRLTRKPEEISLYDIYKAVDNRKLLNVDTETNPECGLGQNIQLAIADYYDQIQRDVEQEMRIIKLADILARYHQRLNQWSQKD